MESATEAAVPPPPGQILAAERERQGLSRAEIAQRLHMSPSQVEALESGEYSRLPKGPFLRGFVRNYAKSLGLDAESVVARLAHETPAESAPRIVVPSQNIRFDPLGDRLSNPYVKAAGLAAVAIALGFAAMYWWLFIRTTPPAAHKPADMPPITTPAPQPTPSAANTAPLVQGTLSPSSTQASMPSATPAANPPAQSSPRIEPPPAKAEPSKPDAAKADAAKAAAKGAPVVAAKGEGVLQFRFNGESWVEVRDASGKVVFQRLNDAGSDATVTGKLPLQVIVGNASGVTLRYNGRDFPLEPHTKVAVARFTLE